MHYPVHFETQSSPVLSLLGRHRAAQDQLFCQLEGCALLRLGKQEFLLRAGDLFWLPADCLHGLTLWQNSRIGRLQFSVRVTAPRPTRAGFLPASPLLRTLIARLASLPDTDLGDWEGHAGRLLRLITDLLPEWHITAQSELTLCPGIATALEGLMQGHELTQVVHRSQAVAGYSPRVLLDRFHEAVGYSLIDWQEQWQLYHTLQGIRQGLSEEQAFRRAGIGSVERYQQSVQRYLQPAVADSISTASTSS